MNLITLEKDIQKAIRQLPDENYMLGRTLMQPFKPANSGSRALMNSVHVEHFMVLSHGEVPNVQTGYETEFGECSTSYVKTDADYEIVYKIPKFSFNPGHHYFLIVRNMSNGEYDVIERVSYKYNTESYGYLWNNDTLDKMTVGSIIKADTPIKTSIGYDVYGNKMNGVNLVTLYLSCAQNMEDSVILSESAAKKLETNLVMTTPIMINENDVLLNLYGAPNSGEYKAFPDVGESVKGGIFCVIRRVENKDVLYTQADARQRDFMLPDRPILINGIVADIDVYSNNPEFLATDRDNIQLYKYYQEKQNFCNTIVELIGPIAMNHKMSYALQKLYGISRETIHGREYLREKPYNSAILSVTVIRPLMMEPGDKCSDRYGGKGVCSIIVPDEYMPILDNGVRVEKVSNQSTCINRENLGQLHEQSVSFTSMRMIDRMKEGLANATMTYRDCFQLWYDYVHILDEQQADFALLYVDRNDEAQCQYFIDNVIETGIVISIQPFTTTINIDTIRAIYDRFPWIEPYRVKVPMEDSNGNIRYVEARRPMVAGRIYNYRLKQYAEEKFSVTSLSATNLKNLNTRSKAAKVYETKYTKTPIMFGFMESADMIHLGIYYLVMNLMLYSNSPQARRLFEYLSIGDPYHIDIRLDQDSKNRNAEIIHSLFKNIGIRLRFVKKPKEIQRLYKNLLYKDVPNKLWTPDRPGSVREIIGYDDVPELRYATATKATHKSGKPLFKNVLYRNLGEDGLPIFKTNIQEIFRQYAEGNIDVSDIL